MQAIKFEAIADQHMLRLLDQVPDDAKLRVLLLLDDAMNAVPKRRLEDRPRRKLSSRLASSVVMHDNLTASAVLVEDWWDALNRSIGHAGLGSLGRSSGESLAVRHHRCHRNCLLDVLL
jgi:hypothetical protein